MTSAPDSAGRLSIHYAASDNIPEKLRAIISSGEDIDIQDNHGWTALHFAADCGNLEPAKILLDAGADLSLISRQHKTALDRAVATPAPGGVDVAKLIFLRGGDPHHKDDLGNDAISYLEMLDPDSRKKPLLEFFREHGVE